ncbi:MAG: LacI family DNA-binding transcriptional regulator [Candidatus Omnitrophota bacterium]|nr:MAG: LacI family DNA-binding transcriptional regulator [Candidatus Omnitrophota bacterium]
MSSKNTIKEVAKAAGVSIATVSRFLNNPAALRKENRIKVEKAVKELNYHPFIFARRLAGGRLNTFGLIIPGYEGIFYSFYAMEIIRGISAALNAKGIDLHLHIFGNKDNFRASLVDGVIFADIIENEKQFERLLKNRTPILVMNKKIERQNVSYVAINNFKGAYEATEFLIHHGHKKIAHLAGTLFVQCAQERLEGYKLALQKNGININNDYIKVTNFSRKEAREKLEQLFSLKERPTAVFCCSDEVASEVLSFCEEKKIEVPKKLSIIGFDDNPHCLYGNLMLTTVRQPFREMTQLAVEILRELVEAKTDHKKIVLDTELIVRDTVSFI